MKTTLYLIRHGATDLNLAKPYRLQGRRLNPPLAHVGVCQALQTSDFLSQTRFDVCYSSPLSRAMQTALIIGQRHQLEPIPLDSITECDIGDWEGKNWDEIRAAEPESYTAFHADPSQFGYPGGESFADVYQRVQPSIDELFTKHRGQTILVVAHHVVNRTYLAGLLGLPISQARRVSLANCGISIVVREAEMTKVETVNAAFHLRVNRAA